VARFGRFFASAGDQRRTVQIPSHKEGSSAFQDIHESTWDKVTDEFEMVPRGITDEMATASA